MSKESNKIVFVIVDEKVIAETLAAILRLQGCSSFWFVNPLNAFEAAQQGAPDWLSSDVMMPELSGIDLAIRIRVRCPHCKILLFSGHAETIDVLMVAREKGHSFLLLTKPVHPSILLEQIRAYTVTPPIPYPPMESIQ